MRFTHALRGAVLSAFLLASVSAAVFNFDSLVPGTSTPFSDTQGGVTATFSSPTGVFSVTAVFFSTLTGQALLDADLPLHTLNIAFSQPLSSIGMVFALDTLGGTGNLFLTAFSGGIGGTVVGVASAAGAVPPGFVYPEGSILFNGAMFDAVAISSNQQDFAIDHLGVNVPEPGALALCLIGLTGLAVMRCRRAMPS